ncbi:FAD-binding oxidoreductase [Vallitalea pronyensis]|uniref:FAD-binding oxidoreductase n=1 Tax=Vallitalea pronyensis TaxID=1348613 RepID=A0A8J8MN88_9FIRM|nr:FAD-binding oxidoreductase [Vallitalea pronyensis]QUI24661.1 FAD-binding oxidoreductase [Vallitalea pronyensis]
MTKKYDGFMPEWEHTAPPEKSFRSIFKWGSPTEYKSPNERLYKVMKDTFGLTDDYFKKKQEEGLKTVDVEVPIQLSQEQIETFSSIVGQEHIKKDTYTRLKVSYGNTMIDLMRLRKGIIEHLPDVVLYPSNKTQIEAIVRYCSQEKIPIYCKSGGSTVTRGMEAVKGGVSLDLAVNFNKVIAFNEKNQTITVESGMQGPELERVLNGAPELLGASKPYTCGHFPQSFEYSGVGGWVVTRGAGQNSSYYGKIEDIVICQEYATPVGVIKTEEYPAMATGPSIDQIMMGSEGAFGVLTHVTLKVFRYMPENRIRFSYIFPSWENAQAAAKEITQGEFGMPSVFRLSDPEETSLMLKLYNVEGTKLGSIISKRGYKPMERCLFLGFTDGEKGFCKNMKKKLHRICKKYGAMYLTGYPTKEWEKGRFKDPYMRDALGDFGVIIDTMECSVTWDTMPEVHQGLREYCKARPETICLTHMSHVYPQGANLYFIIIARMEMEEYLDYQAGILDNYIKYGAAISHHHGVGKSFGPWLEHDLGANGYSIIKTLKEHFDPDNIMNPGGTLGLDVEKRELKFK